MVIWTEFLAVNPVSQTDAEAQRMLLRDYEQKFAERPEQKLTKLCSNAGFFRRKLTEDSSSLHLKDQTI